MKRLHRCIPVAMCVGLASSVALADWLRIDHAAAQNTEHHLNMATVKQTGPMSIYRQVQVLTQGAAVNKPSVASVVSLYEYDCMSAKWRMLESAGFSLPWGEGNKVVLSARSASAPDWQALPDSALGQPTVDLLCPGGKDD